MHARVHLLQIEIKRRGKRLTDREEEEVEKTGIYLWTLIHWMTFVIAKRLALSAAIKRKTEMLAQFWFLRLDSDNFASHFFSFRLKIIVYERSWLTTVYTTVIVHWTIAYSKHSWPSEWKGYVFTVNRKQPTQHTSDDNNDSRLRNSTWWKE